MSKRNLSAGLLAEWQRICKESADVLPLTNGVAVTSCGSETLKRVEESMARLGMKVGSKMTRNSTDGKVKSITNGKADRAVDDVISFNVGGTIIAVLRSTLLLQAPNSTFAARYSDRWVQQPDEVDKFGNIYMVKEKKEEGLNKRGNDIKMKHIFLHHVNIPKLVYFIWLLNPAV